MRLTFSSTRAMRLVEAETISALLAVAGGLFGARIECFVLVFGPCGGTDL